MAFVTAIAVLMAGASFAAHAANRPRLGSFIGAIIAIGAVFTLLLYRFAEGLHLKPPFVYDPGHPSMGVGFDGRMSPNTAICVGLLGSALWLVGRQRIRLGAVLLCAVLIQSICFAGLCGYLFKLKDVAAWWRLTGMSLPTAAALIGASLALLGWTRRYAAQERRIWSGALPFFSCAMGVIIVVALVALVSSGVKQTSDEGVVATVKITSTLARLESALAALDHDGTNSLSAGSSARHQTAADARRVVRSCLQQLATFSGSREAASIDLGALRSAVDVHLKRVGTVGDAESEEKAGRIRYVTGPDPTFALIADLIAAHEAKLVRALEESAPLRFRSNVLVIGGSLLSAALLGMALVVLRIAERDKVRSEEALVKANAELERKVEARTTDLSQLNAKLLESEHSFRALAECMPQIVWTTGPDGRGEFYNQQWYAYTGLDEEQSLEAVVAVIHEADRAACLTAWKSAREAKTAFEYELRLRRRDGTFRWFLARSSPQFDPRTGELGAWIGTSTDIHDRKLAAVALEERVEERTFELGVAKRQLEDALVRKRRVLDRIAGMVYEFRLDPAGHASCPFVSAGVTKLFGVQPKEVYANAQILFDAIHSDDRNAVDRSVAESAEKLLPWRCEYRIRSRDGSEKWLLGKADPERCDDGSIVWCGYITDITEDRAIGSALQESNDRFRTAFESAGIGMALVSPVGQFIRVNPRLCEIVGYAPEDLIAKTFQEITHPDDLEIDLEEVRRLLAGESQYYHLEKRYFHREGHIVWINLTASLVKNAAGTPLHFVAQIEDITDRKTLQTSLALARDEAVAKAREKSAFLANMSHEIRTPMNGIIGVSGLLMDTPMSEEQRELARLIQNSGDNLVALINDILDFSKLEAGKFRIDPCQFDIRSTIEETAALLAGGADQKGLELVCDVDPRLRARLMGDAGRIRQVMTNLIGNAIKFTTRGEVVVRVRLEAPQVADRCDLHITIKDSGIGISSGIQSQLFEPFTQADAATTTKFGGTGLGLAISRQLVTLMGGTIGVESEPGHGATFWIKLSLPWAAEPPSAMQPLTNPEFRVLIVDDNIASGEALSHQLTALGATPYLVFNGDTAIVELTRMKASGRPFAFALIDWRLGSDEGFDVARKIRDDSSFKSTRLIFLGPSGPDRVVDFAQKFDASLVKPVGLGALNRCLRRLAGFSNENTMSPFHAAPIAPLAQAKGSLRILLVEDNATNQIVASGVLKKLGHKIQIAADGAKALICLSRQSFDLILMDCQMPILNGYETTRMIRSGAVPGLNPQVPVIALTASVMPEEQKKCVEAGMDGYVAKPIRLAELEIAISRCVGVRNLSKG